MLGFAQSSSSSSSSSSQNQMELSVLERQRVVMLQRLYDQQQNDHISSIAYNHQQLLSQMATTSNNNSSVTRVKMSEPELQCNSSFAPNKSYSIKKRKAEFDIAKVEVNETEEERDEQSDITTKIDREACSKESSKASDVQKPDYIHVRARRGQATDSHSLAERARREKISKKMKCLQDLVPGCHKVTGKAGMLDEIINYVQSLQKQVEFLSMKLATVNPRLDFNTNNLFQKAIPAYIASLQGPEAQFNATNSTYFESDVSMAQSQMLHQKSANSSVPIPEMFLDPAYISQLQQLSGWESDWPNLFNIGFQ